MGIESFYLTVQTQTFDARKIMQKYSDLIAVSCDMQDCTVCMTGTLVSFLPACEVIYRACCEISAETQIISVQSHGKKGDFHFDTHEMPAFLSWMYSCWQEKLAYFHAEWGAFLILPSAYYDMRRKLKNYYKRLPEREDFHADN